MYPKLAEKCEAKYFLGRLEELAELDSVNAQNGLDLSQAIESGAVIYVRGSVSHPTVILAQRMLMAEIVHYAEHRTVETGRTICMVADELRYHISRPVIDALATIRDKSVHLLSTFQSLTDLRDVPLDLSSDVVSGSVIENATWKASYKLQDPGTAEWFARLSGTVLVDEESRFVATNWAGAEIVEAKRMIKQSEDYCIPANALLQLPAGVAVIYTPVGPKYVRICHMPVQRSQEFVTPSYVDRGEKTTSVSAASLIDV